MRVYLSLALLLLLVMPPGTGAASFPRLPDNVDGKVGWSSGFVVTYGLGRAPDYLTNPTLKRSAARKAAYLDASRRLISLCLSIRVQGKITVRDHFRQDNELQNAFREMLRSLPPWEIKYKSSSEVKVAIRLPLGGEGGLNEILGESTEAYLNPYDGLPESFLSSWYPAGQEPTGLVLVVDSGEAEPALRPRIVSSVGGVMLDYSNSSQTALQRVSFVPFYQTLQKALEDPLTGDNPLVFNVLSTNKTDFILPDHMEPYFLHTATGQRILSDVLLVIVLPH